MANSVTLLAHRIAETNTTKIPISFDDNAWLYGAKLGEMTAASYLAIAFAGWLAWHLVADQRSTKWNEPVTLYRVILFFFSLGCFLRCGGEAALLWSRTSDAVTAARVTMVRNWTDVIGVGFYLVAMAIAILSASAMFGHLKRRPFPVRMWEQRSKLVRPSLIVACSLVMASVVVLLR